MDNQAYNFLSLLGALVNNKDSLDLKSPIDWDEILDLAHLHNVYALVFEKIANIPEFYNSLEYQKSLTKVKIQIMLQVQRDVEFLNLYQSFLNNSIYPIVMKGIICRQLYGKYADHRPSSDEDLLISLEQYNTAKIVLEDQGYFAENDFTIDQLKELQEVSFINKKTNLVIELHINPMGNDNDSYSRMNDCFENVFKNYREVGIHGISVRTMSHTDHFLFLVLHAFRHFTCSGFGIRQVLDILLYKKEFEVCIDWNYIKEQLSRFDAFLFLSDLIYIGNKYLGFEFAPLSRPCCPEELIEDLLNNGAFGNSTQVQRTANQMTGAAVFGKGKKMIKSLTLLRTLFPSKSQLLVHNPELQMKPWLLPICWVKRWKRFITHSKNNEGNLAKESIELSQRRIKLLKKYNII